MKVRHEQHTGFNPAVRRGLGRLVKAALIASLTLTVLGAGGGQALAKESTSCERYEGKDYCGASITVVGHIGGSPVPTPPPMPGGGGSRGSGGGGSSDGGALCADAVCERIRDTYFICGPQPTQKCLDNLRKAREEADRAREKAEREEAARKAEEKALQERLASIRKSLEKDYPACLAQVEKWRSGEVPGAYSCLEFTRKICAFSGSGNPVGEFVGDACKKVWDRFPCDQVALANVNYCKGVRDCILRGEGSYYCRMKKDWGRIFGGGSYRDPWPDEWSEEMLPEKVRGKRGR